MKNYVGKILLRENIKKNIMERLYCTSADGDILTVKDKNGDMFEIQRQHLVLFGDPFATDFKDFGLDDI